MSVFSKIRSSKKAPEQSGPLPEVARDSNGNPIVKERYRHIPTHAATDALSCAPSSWKSEGMRSPTQSGRMSRVTSSKTLPSLGKPNFATKGSYQQIHRPGELGASRSMESFNHQRVMSRSPSSIDTVLSNTRSKYRKRDEVSPTPSSSSSGSTSSLSSHLEMQTRLQQPTMDSEQNMNATRKVVQALQYPIPPPRELPIAVLEPVLKKKSRWMTFRKGHNVPVAITGAA